MVKEKIQGETTRERFKRLATKRTQEVIEKIRILGNCANPYMYSYSDDEIKQIFKAIDEELKSVKAKFAVRRGHRFKLE